MHRYSSRPGVWLQLVIDRACTGTRPGPTCGCN